MLRICFWSGYNPCQKLHFQRSKGPSYTLQLPTKSEKNRTKMAQTQPQGLTKAFMASQSGCAEVALWSHFCATVTSRRKIQNSLHMQTSDPCHVLMSIYSRGRCGWNASTQPFPLARMARGMLSGKSPKWSGLPSHEP